MASKPTPKKKRKPAATKVAAGTKRAAAPRKAVWLLRLYVAGQTPRSLTAFANLKKLCESHLPDRYRIEVVDLVKEPHRAKGDEILALPTLVRKLPEPVKRVIGDLSNFERVLLGLELKREQI